MFYKCGTVNFALRVVVASVMLTATSLPARSAEWEPPPPMPDKFDWVQLKSGEWLKGEIKVMYEGSIEFESEELDLLDPRLRGHQAAALRPGAQRQDAGRQDGDRSGSARG